MDGHDSARTFRSAYKGPSRAKVLWTFEANDPTAFTSPAIGRDGTVYTGAGDLEKLYALAPDGKVRWFFPSKGRPFEPPAVASDGTVYFGGDSPVAEGSRFYAVAPSGVERWHIDTPSLWFFAPAINSSGTIYFGGYTVRSQTSSLYSVDASGTILWKIRLRDRLQGVAIGPDGTLYATTAYGPPSTLLRGLSHLYAFGPGGSKRWDRKLPPGLVSSPSVGSGGTIYVGYAQKADAKGVAFVITGGALVAFDESGREKWSLPAGGIISSPAVASDGTVYVSTDERDGRRSVLRAVMPNGSPKWALKQPDLVSTPAIDRDGTLYLQILPGRLVALRPDGSKKWEMNLPSSDGGSPVIAANGRLYCPGGDGLLYAIGER